jgi:hypothetical protein
MEVKSATIIHLSFIIYTSVARVELQMLRRLKILYCKIEIID